MYMLKDKNGNSVPLSRLPSKIINRFRSYYLDFCLFLLSLTTWIPSHTIRNFIWKISGLKLGKKSTLHTGVRVFNPAGIKIGQGTIVGFRSFLDGRRSLVIGDNTDIASEVMIYNEEHDLESPDFEAVGDQVTIGDHVFIGPRAIILPGVTIADNAVVAAGAVVTKNVGKGEIVGGIPAKKISDRKLDNPSYKLGRFKLFQ